jgi:hypothetical protein
VEVERTTAKKKFAIAIPTFYIIIFAIEIHNLHVIDRYNDMWVGRFCQWVDVLQIIKMALLKNVSELHPLFDASSPPGCCRQSHEILLNQGMKYWDSAWNASGSRTVHIAAAVIGWKRSGKERTGQTQFSTKFAAKLSFMPRRSPVYFLFLFFEISSPMWPNRGFRCRLWLTLRITLLSHKSF